MNRGTLIITLFIRHILIWTMLILFPIKHLMNYLCMQFFLFKYNQPASNHLNQTKMLNLTCICLPTPSKKGATALTNRFHWNSMPQKRVIIPVSLPTLIIGLYPGFFIFTHLYISSCIHSWFTYKNSSYSYKVCIPMIKVFEHSEILL